jgi:hypothetical protein
LSSFRKRAADARLQNSTYKSASTTIDFEHYRSILKNKDVVAEGEKLFKSFKPADYDVQAQLKAIAAFEGKAVSSARDFGAFRLGPAARMGRSRGTGAGAGQQSGVEPGAGG